MFFKKTRELFVLLIFLLGISAATCMDSNRLQRIVSETQALSFAEKCLPMVHDEGLIPGSIQELTSIEGGQQNNTPGVIDPQLFLYQGKNDEYIIKMAKKRAQDEIRGAKYITRRCPSMEIADIEFCAPIFCAIFRDRAIGETKPIHEFDENELNQEDSILEFMKKAPGVPLEELVNSCYKDPSTLLDKMLPIFGRLGNGIREMNDQQIYHNDLHWNNIIVDPKSNVISFIDFERCSSRDCFKRTGFSWLPEDCVKTVCRLSEHIYWPTGEQIGECLQRFLSYCHPTQYIPEVVLRNVFDSMIGRYMEKPDWNQFFKVSHGVLKKIHAHMETKDKSKAYVPFLYDNNYKEKMLKDPNKAHREEYLLLMYFYNFSLQERKEIAKCLELEHEED
jgi:hypothetical protein